MRSTLLALALLSCLAPRVEAWTQASACPAVNARLNTSRALKVGVDFVPVTADDSLGFYVIYSPHVDRTSTACMFVLPLQQREALLFGAGYGDFSDAKADAQLVDSVFTNCMGRRSVKLRVVAPHGHGDHVNPALLRELRALGHEITEIAFHVDDRPWLDAMAYTPTDKSLFRSLPRGACNEPILTLNSWLGRLWFSSRPGHTPGSIDLVIDVKGDPTDRVLVRGSLAGGSCPEPPSGIRLVVDPHGTVVIPGSTRPATVSVYNGVGSNRLCLSSPDLPRQGSTWHVELDATGVTAARSLVLFGFDRPLDPGRPITAGELLVDIHNGTPLTGLVQSKDQSTFALNIPSDPAFLGFEAWFQGWILGDPPELCNALHIVIGT